MLYRSGNYTGWYLSSGVPLFWSNGHRALLYLVLIVGIISLCFFADSVFKENVATRAAARAKPQPADNKVDSLVRLKTLLDNGTITQEEFEEKKKNLLET
ncbi:MAG: SHOCT domain-containing protein [Ruminococcaceae bacterium]|nr:SHOCT domain-containing protein [Oscillospiraceae bacterium]